MPNRILKESICVSESVDSLNWFEEIVFYRLIVNCDDYGRFDARPSVVKARLFPLKDRLTTKDVESALKKLADADIVRLYRVDNKPYLYFPNWEVHQTIRAKKSRYPSPDEAMQADEIICKQMQADVAVIQSNTNTNPNPNTNPNCVNADVRTDDFDAFWKAYPRKSGKEAARKAFKACKGVNIQVLLNAIEGQKNSRQWQKDGGQYIPNPATWLNQGRWQDEVQSASGYVDGCNRTMDSDELAAIQRMFANGE